MLFWYSAMTLALDAAKVMEVRLRMMALGQSSPAEMFLMVSEKFEAMDEARKIIGRGGNPSQVVDSYRKIVSANAARLGAR
jgi:hypothetical protein